ncbi:hypothetical protein BV22DRAFT_1047324 [Leucogyrophana mollusca]|uniref:Uncharacterized protein n=1 Tax=Leucogyrophana mollusca TaxID=85980 RepID=A0ACB8BIP2_9AGAM|nr:hypothetical protein BV22DRAFT_1047324 [Leucogyrophana mollusca]
MKNRDPFLSFLLLSSPDPVSKTGGEAFEELLAVYTMRSTTDGALAILGKVFGAWRGAVEVWNIHGLERPVPGGDTPTGDKYEASDFWRDEVENVEHPAGSEPDARPDLENEDFVRSTLRVMDVDRRCSFILVGFLPYSRGLKWARRSGCGTSVSIQFHEEGEQRGAGPGMGREGPSAEGSKEDRDEGDVDGWPEGARHVETNLGHTFDTTAHSIYTYAFNGSANTESLLVPEWGDACPESDWQAPVTRWILKAYHCCRGCRRDPASADSRQ